MRNTIASLLVAVCVVGCSKKEKEAPPPAPALTPTSPAPAPAPAAAPTPAPAPASTAHPNVTPFPDIVLPQLSGDGTSVIAPQMVVVNQMGKTKTSVIVVGADGKTKSSFDATKKGAIDEVQKLLTDGGYKPFETMVALESATLPVKLGTFSFEMPDSDTGVKLRLADDKGAKVQELDIPIAKKCSANPRPDYVWFDSARKRVFIEVGWELGPHDCNDAPEKMYVVWTTP